MLFPNRFQLFWIVLQAFLISSIRSVLFACFIAVCVVSTQAFKRWPTSHRLPLFCVAGSRRGRRALRPEHGSRWTGEPCACTYLPRDPAELEERNTAPSHASGLSPAAAGLIKIKFRSTLGDGPPFRQSSAHRYPPKERWSSKESVMQS